MNNENIPIQTFLEGLLNLCTFDNVRSETPSFFSFFHSNISVLSFLLLLNCHLCTITSEWNNNDERIHSICHEQRCNGLVI